MSNLFVTILLIGMILAVLAIFCFSFPSFKDFWKYCISVRYRFMYNLYQIYRNKEVFGWDYSYTYLEKAKNWLNEHLGKEGQNYNLAEMIFTRLSREEFVKYYFSVPKFRYDDFKLMWSDMENGKWQNNIYDSETRLKQTLPVGISYNSQAFQDFMKFVAAGWFDAITGMYTNKVAKEYSASALYRIGQKNHIPSIEKIIAPVWNENPDTIRSRWRRDKKDPKVLKVMDDIIDSIIDS